MPTEVEVLLATYNGAAFLREQVDSILAQEGVRACITARDDGSSDDTPAILRDYAERFPDRIRLLPATARRGPRGAFSELLLAARSDFIAFADQDDVWLPHKLRTLLARLRALEEKVGPDRPGLVHCDLSVVDRQLIPISPSFWSYSLIDPRRNSFRDLLFRNTVTGCATLFNRALKERAAPVPDDAIMHDHWLALCAAAYGAIDFEPQALVLYRQHGGNSIGAVAGQRGVLSRAVRVLRQGGLGPDYWTDRLRQPRAFWREHGTALPPEHRRTLQVLLASPERAALVRRWLLFRYGLGPGRGIARLVFWLLA